MVKAIKYFLSLYIFLLSGHNFLNANESKDFIRFASIKALERSAYSAFISVQNSLNTSITSVSSGKEKENEGQELIAYDDDDELISFKKYLGNNNYATSIFCTQTLGSFFSGHKNILSPNKYASYTGSYRYLAFRAFRI